MELSFRNRVLAIQLTSGSLLQSGAEASCLLPPRLRLTGSRLHMTAFGIIAGIFSEA